MIERRPFRFGVQFAGVRTSTEWKERARKAEALGYDILVMPDHFGGQFAIGPALAVGAAATTTLRIGTFVLQNGLRHLARATMRRSTSSGVVPQCRRTARARATRGRRSPSDRPRAKLLSAMTPGIVPTRASRTA